MKSSGTLLKDAPFFNAKPDKPVVTNMFFFIQQLQSMLLSPLQEMSNVSFSDIRYKQLECVLQVGVLYGA